MEIPADIVDADGHLVPGQYDCRKAAPGPGVKPSCVYFYFNGVRYEAALLPQQPAACFAGTPDEGIPINSLDLDYDIGSAQLTPHQQNVLLAQAKAKAKMAAMGAEVANRQSIPALRQTTSGAALKPPDLVAEFQSLLLAAKRAAYYKGFSDAKRLLLAVEPPLCPSLTSE